MRSAGPRVRVMLVQGLSLISGSPAQEDDACRVKRRGAHAGSVGILSPRLAFTHHHKLTTEEDNGETTGTNAQKKIKEAFFLSLLGRQSGGFLPGASTISPSSAPTQHKSKIHKVTQNCQRTLT